MFVKTPVTFYLLRFLLGAAEAGFFPGIIFYLALWFPAAQRARAIARFMTAVPVSGLIGGPLSGALLEMNGLLGLKGWQWLFLLEGVPAILLGLSVPFCLGDRPETARWLTSADKKACGGETGLPAERSDEDSPCPESRDAVAVGNHFPALSDGLLRLLLLVPSCHKIAPHGERPRRWSHPGWH